MNSPGTSYTPMEVPVNDRIYCVGMHGDQLATRGKRCFRPMVFAVGFLFLLNIALAAFCIHLHGQFQKFQQDQEIRDSQLRDWLFTVGNFELEDSNDGRKQLVRKGRVVESPDWIKTLAQQTGTGKDAILAQRSVNGTCIFTFKKNRKLFFPSFHCLLFSRKFPDGNESYSSGSVQSVRANR